MANQNPGRVTYQHARNLYDAGRPDEAEAVCHQVLQRTKNDVATLLLLSSIFADRHRFDEAHACASRALKLKPRDPISHLHQGLIFAKQHNFPDALASFECGLNLDPTHINLLELKASIFEVLGRRDEAGQLLGPYLGTDRESPFMAEVACRLAIGRGDLDEAIARAQAHIEQPRTPPSSRALLYTQMGQAQEKAGRFDEAFHAYDAANAIERQPFYEPDHRRKIDELINVFSRLMLPAFCRASNQSELPVLVVGMPRSGTTLIERIITAHPEAQGAGELEFLMHTAAELGFAVGSVKPYPGCVLELSTEVADRLVEPYLAHLAEVGRGAARVVDKMPHNHEHLGLAALLLPGARVIHCRRDPANTCFSMFASRLNAHIHPYSTDLSSLGVVYRHYLRLMDHWRDVQPLPMLEVDYEELVVDTEPWCRRIIEFCGLPWDDRCLEFHTAGSQTYSLSYEQVRKPIYRTSANRAANFHAHLGPLHESLGDLV